MQNPRRKRILLFASVLVVATIIIGYVFRYPLILKFQYSRLQSLKCRTKTGNTNANCHERIWVHRVNSLERYDILDDKFDGFETDIVFNDSSGTLSVYHPPLPPGGDTLSLEEFFRHTVAGNKHFWLDTRFVDSSNMNRALAAFAVLNERYPVQRSSIVELYDVAAAELFALNGYTVSFNVSDAFQSVLENNPSLRDSIAARLALIKYVSQDSRYLPVVKRLFPGKMIITWQPRFTNFFDTELFQQLLDDPQVAIVLVNIKTRFYR